MANQNSSKRPYDQLSLTPRGAGFSAAPPLSGLSSGPQSVGGSQAPRPSGGTPMSQQHAQATTAKRPRIDNGDVLAGGGLGSGGGSLGILSPAVSGTSEKKNKVVIKIADDKVGVVIGRSNDNLRYMQSKSGASIKVGPHGDGLTEVTVCIEGSPQCVENAKQMITESTREGYRLHRLPLGHHGSLPKRKCSPAFTPPAAQHLQSSATPAAWQHLQSSATPAAVLHLQATPSATSTNNQSFALLSSYSQQSGGQQNPVDQYQSHDTRQPVSNTAASSASSTTYGQEQVYGLHSGSHNQSHVTNQITPVGNYYQNHGIQQAAPNFAAAGAATYGTPSISAPSGGRRNDSYYGYGAQGQHLTGNYRENTGTQPPTGSYWSGYHGAPPDDYVWRQPKGGGHR